MIKWKDIASAPKDTSRGDFLITRFNSLGDHCWVTLVRNPTNHHGMTIASHWTPLGEPPADYLDVLLRIDGMSENATASHASNLKGD